MHSKAGRALSYNARAPAAKMMRVPSMAGFLVPLTGAYYTNKRRLGGEVRSGVRVGWAHAAVVFSCAALYEWTISA